MAMEEGRVLMGGIHRLFIDVLRVAEIHLPSIGSVSERRRSVGDGRLVADY